MRHGDMATPIHFLPVQASNRKRSRLDREVERTEAKSHAATVSHWQHRADRKRRQYARAISCGDKDAAPPCISRLGDCSLDPFLRLAVDLSLGERDLLQDYLIYTPQAVYGTSDKSPFCPVRDISQTSFWTNAVSVRWSVFLARHCRILAQGRIPENDPLTLRHKHEAYESMSAELANLDHSSSLNDTLYGVLNAGIIEHRISDCSTARKHLEASFLICAMHEQHGPKQWMACPTGLTMCVGFLGIGLENFYQSSSTLHQGQNEALGSLEDMERWNHRIRCTNLARFGRSQVAAQPQRGSKPNAVDEYLRTRYESFGVNGIVRTHLVRLMGAVVECGTRLCLGALYAVNDILYTLRHNEFSAITFLSSLTAKMRSPDGSGQLPRLSRIAIMYMIASCAQEVDTSGDEPGGCFHLWSWAQFVELMMLTSDDSRRRMTQTLAAWLFADITSPEELSMGSAWQRNLLREESELAWRQKQSAPLVDMSPCIDLDGFTPTSDDSMNTTP